MNNNKYIREYEMVDSLRMKNNTKLSIYFAYIMNPKSGIDPWTIMVDSLCNLSPIEQETIKLNIIRSIETFFEETDNISRRESFMNELLFKLRDIKHGIEIDIEKKPNTSSPVSYILENCKGQLPDAFLRGVEDAYKSQN